MKNYEDWDWSKYTEVYMRQIIEVYRDKLFDVFISPDGLSYSENGVEFKDNLHDNHKEIYHLAYKFQPKSILECGCGCGCHIKNLLAVLPNVEIFGIDISPRQVELANWFCQFTPEISKNISVMDISKEAPNRTFDFVFTQAVLMHLTTEKAMKALANMKKVSNKYVLLIESPVGHPNWEGLIKEIFSGWEFSKPRRFPQDGILLTKV